MSDSPNLEEKYIKSHQKEGKITESPRRRRRKEEEEPIYTFYPEKKGVRVTVQPQPPRPKWNTIGFISYNGKLTYYQPEGGVEQRIKDKMEYYSRLGKQGKLEDKVRRKN